MSPVGNCVNSLNRPTLDLTASMTRCDLSGVTNADMSDMAGGETGVNEIMRYREEDIPPAVWSLDCWLSRNWVDAERLKDLGKRL